jgi:circadian clock protein KaiC
MAGSGKSSVAAHFADAACRRGESVLYFAFEESAAQIERNMRSIGLDLRQWIDAGQLRFKAHRPSLQGLEMHLAGMYRDIQQHRPSMVIVDPISSLLSAGDDAEVHAMLLRLFDLLKARGITSVFVSLTHGTIEQATTDVQVSSLIDTWLLLANREASGEFTRQLYLLKSRGMAHSNQLREFLLTDEGIRLQPVYVGPSGVLTGSAKRSQAAKDESDEVLRRQEIERRERELVRRRRQLELQIDALKAEVEAEAEELERLTTEGELRERQRTREREMMALSRTSTRPVNGS